MIMIEGHSTSFSHHSTTHILSSPVLSTDASSQPRIDPRLSNLTGSSSASPNAFNRWASTITAYSLSHCIFMQFRDSYLRDEIILNHLDRSLDDSAFWPKLRNFAVQITATRQIQVQRPASTSTFFVFILHIISTKHMLYFTPILLPRHAYKRANLLTSND